MKHLTVARTSLKRYSIRHASTSNNEPALAEEKKEEKKEVKSKEEKTILAKLLPKKLSDFLNNPASAAQPTNLGFQNERGIENYDPQMNLKTFLKETPLIAKKHSMKFGKEMYELCRPKWEKPDIYKTVRGSRHGESIIQYDFTSDENFKKWSTGCDSEWGQGYSKCDFFRTESNTAMFSGNISTALVKDGKTKRAGWCGIRTDDKQAFDRKLFYQEWDHFSHLIVKCRGDGRSYKLMLHSPGPQDASWGNSHSYPLHTHGGPYWQYEKLPFSRFFHTVNTRIQDKQYAVKKPLVSSVGITLMDKINGPFKLEIGFVGVWHDESHSEKFAYENYAMPGTI